MSDLSILRRFYGSYAKNWSEDMIVKYAIKNGYALADANPTDHGGVVVGQESSLLKAFGIDVHTIQNASVFDLQNELAKGHAVKVLVDADELWKMKGGAFHTFLDRLGFGTPNHVVVCSELNTDDPTNVRVTLQDTGNGKIYSVPWSEFAQASDDANYTLVCSDHSSEEFRALHPEWFGGNANYLQELYRHSVEQYALWQQNVHHQMTNYQHGNPVGHPTHPHNDLRFTGDSHDPHTVHQAINIHEHHHDAHHLDGSDEVAIDDDDPDWDHDHDSDY